MSWISGLIKSFNDGTYMNPLLDIIYKNAKNNLGVHLTLNDAVPPEVGCAEAVSFILKAAGTPNFPQGGISGTSDLYAWLRANFEPSGPVPGAIIISPTGSGNGKVRGHTGIVGYHGICSNDSQTGLFLELWTLEKWQQYYGQYGELPVAFFIPKAPTMGPEHYL